MTMLTDEQIEAIYKQETGALIDDSPWALVDFSRAIEAAATEPLLQRIAELEQRNSDFHEGCEIGRAVALAQVKHAQTVPPSTCQRCAELERQLEEARKDAEPIQRWKQRADELLAAFENAPDGKALDMQKGQS